MPEVFALGPVLISTRIAAFVIAFLIARWIASRLAVRWQLDAAWTRSSADVALLIGLVAARLTYAALYWNAFAPAPWTVLYFWQPGYLPVAGLAGAALYMLYRLRSLSSSSRLAALRAISSGFAVGATILAVALFAVERGAGPDVIKAGDRVPDFELVDLQGKRVALSDLGGKGIVLNFWATWCPPCRREMPLLQSLWNEYRARGVVVVGVDVGEPADVARRYIDSQGFDYPIWTDLPSASLNNPDTNALLARFGSLGLPTTVFVRPDGMVDSVYLGELNRALLIERLPKIIPET